VYEVATRFADFMNGSPGFIWIAVISAALAAPLTMLHELGHAVVARRLLPGPVLVNVGHGDSRWEFALCGIDFRVAPVNPFALPAGFCAYDGSSAGARDEVAVALAGPAATLGGLALTLAALGRTGGVLHTVAWVAVLGEAMALCVCLAPIALTDRNGRAWRSDGRLALDALRHLAPRPASIQVRAVRAPAAPSAPTPIAVASPLCVSCFHGRDEHIDLATGRSGACLGQDDDFQTLSATRCACAEYVSAY
jgi:hypothetical protein